MIYYMVSYFLSIICVFCVRKKNINKVTFLCLLFPTILLGFRNNVGLDDIMHVNAYDQFLSIGYTWRSELEVFFKVLLVVCRYCRLKIQFIYFVYAFLTNFFLAKVYNYIVKEKNKLSLLFFLQLYYIFLFFDSMTIMRQMLSVTLMAYILVRFDSRNTIGKIISIVITIVSTLFIHKISFVCFAWYFLISGFNKTEKIKKYVPIIFIFLYLVCMFDYSYIIQKSISYIANGSGYYFFSLFDIKYTSSKYIFKNGDTGITFLFCSVLFLYFSRAKRTKNKLSGDVYSTGVIYIFSRMIFDSFGWIARITLYMSPAYFVNLSVLISDYLLAIKHNGNVKNYRITLLLINILFWGLFILVIMNFGFESSYFNYRFM